VKLWREADQVLNWLTTGVRAQWRMFEIEDQRIYHSGGTWLDYTGLHWDGAEQQYVRTTRRGTAKMYGAKLVENVVQWIARLAVSEAAVRLTDMDLRPVNTTHDELMLVVPGAEGQQALDALLAELRRAPTWMPEIPFDAEGGFAERYTK
jgi:DNA polymerase